jgi:hypothetical protein
MDTTTASRVKWKSRALTVDDFIDKDSWAGRNKFPSWQKCICHPMAWRCPALSRFADPLSREKQRQRSRERARLRKKAGADLFDRVKRAFNCTCEYCGVQGDEGGIGGQRKGYPAGTRERIWSIDRIVPGGDYSDDNVTLACLPCNTGKQRRRPTKAVRSLADVEAFK